MKVYVVRGSEDGVLGVAKNNSAAWRMAYDYVVQPLSDESTKISHTKKTFNTELAESHRVTVYAEGNENFGTAEVEAFFVEEK